MDDVFKTTDKRNRFSEDGHEILNPTPVSPPLGYRKTLSLAEQIRQQVRQLKHIDDDEPETLEEADDFEIDDDPAPSSRWENDMVPSVKEAQRKAKQLEAEVKKYAVPRSATQDNEGDAPEMISE